MEAIAAPGDLVLVSGATGFIAAHAIEQLLSKGYRVRGTVRSTKNAEKNRFLSAMDPSGQRLQLVEADLNDPHAFDQHIKGCKYRLRFYLQASVLTSGS
jgi:uncharacterized protein YbjT (DUF2867 family)